MAIKYSYRCQECELSEVVSGGASAIMAGKTQTYYCKDCSNLFDAMTQACYVKATKTECPQCKGRNLVIWNDGEPCPKCNGNLTIDKNGVMLIAD